MDGFCAFKFWNGRVLWMAITQNILTSMLTHFYRRKKSRNLKWVGLKRKRKSTHVPIYHWHLLFMFCIYPVRFLCIYGHILKFKIAFDFKCLFRFLWEKSSIDSKDLFFNAFSFSVNVMLINYTYIVLTLYQTYTRCFTLIHLFLWQPYDIKSIIISILQIKKWDTKRLSMTKLVI